VGVSATTAPNQVCLNGLAADLWPRTARLEADGDVTVRDGDARLLVRRETENDLLLRDVGV
jgi:hypothetical protein